MQKAPSHTDLFRNQSIDISFDKGIDGELNSQIISLMQGLKIDIEKTRKVVIILLFILLYVLLYNFYTISILLLCVIAYNKNKAHACNLFVENHSPPPPPPAWPLKYIIVRPYCKKYSSIKLKCIRLLASTELCYAMLCYVMQFFSFHLHKK